MECDPANARARQRRARALLAQLKVALGLAAAVVVWWAVWSIVGVRHHWSAMFVPPAVMLAIGLLVLRIEQNWSRPARELAELIDLVRDGQAPIEELSQVRGSLARRLVPSIQSVFHDLKMQRVARAKLEEEIRQRVATRTHALERQIGSLKQQASRDALTGLYNRRMLETYLPRLVERCRRDRVELALLMIDVDHFKPLNDTLGHAAGDELLRNVAQIIRSGIRERDAAFRVGGDEFIVVAPDASAESAEALGKRLVELVDALTRPLKLSQPPRLSIGTAVLSQISQADVACLLAEADRKLYVVKAARGPTRSAKRSA